MKRALPLVVLVVLALLAAQSALPAGAVPTPTMPPPPDCASGADAVGGIWSSIAMPAVRYSALPCKPGDGSTDCRILPNGRVSWDTGGSFPPRAWGAFRINQWYCDADEHKNYNTGSQSGLFTRSRLLLRYGSEETDRSNWGLTEYNGGTGDDTFRIMAAGFQGGMYICTALASVCAAEDPRIPDTDWVLAGEIGGAWPGGHWINDAVEVEEKDSWALVIGNPPPGSRTPPAHGSVTATRTRTPTATATPIPVRQVGGFWKAVGTPGFERWRTYPCRSDPGGGCQVRDLPGGGVDIEWDRGSLLARPMAFNRFYDNPMPWPNANILFDVYNSGAAPYGAWPLLDRDPPFKHWSIGQISGEAAQVYTCDDGPSACGAADPRVPDPEWDFDKWIFPGPLMDSPGHIDPAHAFELYGSRADYSWAFVIGNPTPTPTATPTRTPTLSVTLTPTRTPNPTHTPRPTTDTGGSAWKLPFCGRNLVPAIFDHWWPLYDEQQANACAHEETWRKQYFNGQIVQAIDCGTGNNDGLADFDYVFPDLMPFNGHDGVDFIPPSSQVYTDIVSNFVHHVDRSGPGRVVFAGSSANRTPNHNAADCRTFRQAMEAYSGLVAIETPGGLTIEYADMDTIAVGGGDMVSPDEIFGTSHNLHVAVYRTGQGSPDGGYTPHFDPMGFRISRTEDRWYQRSSISSDQLLPELPLQGGSPAQGLEGEGDTCLTVNNCPKVEDTVVDDSDPGFSCNACLGPSGNVYSWESDYHHMIPTGTKTSTGLARWDTDLPPGTYLVEAWVNPYAVPGGLAWHQLAYAARYSAGNKVVRLNQNDACGASSGPSCSGAQWVQLGIFSYKRISPYIELENAGFYDTGPGGYIDPATCTYIYVDAVRFRPICGFYDEGWPVRGTPETPKTPTPPPTPCFGLGCSGGGAG